MTTWIRHWTPKLEFSVISMFAFVAPITGPAIYVFSRKQASLYSNYWLLYTILFETLILLIIGFILHTRKFKLWHFGLNPSFILTGQGLLLYIVTALASGITVKMVTLVCPETGVHLSSSLNHGSINIVTNLAISIINPLFEEFLLIGYVITSLEKLTTTTQAALASIALRVLCHLYQGPAGMAGVMIMGFVFAYFFIRKRQLWPLIIAHSIWDFLGLLALTRV